MKTIVTSRHFKAHETLTSYAENAIDGLARYYDGIIRAEVILSFERSRRSAKTAEINLHVRNTILTGRMTTDDFFKSVDGTLDKLTRQLKRYKEKLRQKDRVSLRSVRSKT